jgi:hypothetical protein
MNYCPHCGAPNPAERCDRCGADLDPDTHPLAQDAVTQRAGAPYAPPPPRRGSGGLVAGAIVVLAVLLVALGVGVLRPDLIGLRGGSPFAVAGEAPPGSSAGSGSVVPTASDPATGSASGSATGSDSDPATDPAGGSTDAAVALRRQTDADRSALLAVEGSWVPQLSSKRPGTRDAGRTFDAAAILAEHEALRAAHPQARLLWSGDWASFSTGDYWVTVLADPSTSPAGANAWCDAQGFGADDCFAKLLSRTGGSSGTAVHR